MATRLDLQNELEEMLGSRNVYYRPPETLKINIPGIVYTPIRKGTIHADDTRYLGIPNYKVVVMSKTPDHPVIEKLLDRRWCIHETTYMTNGLYHDVFTLFN